MEITDTIFNVHLYVLPRIRITVGATKKNRTQRIFLVEIKPSQMRYKQQHQPNSVTQRNSHPDFLQRPSNVQYDAQCTFIHFNIFGYENAFLALMARMACPWISQNIFRGVCCVFYLSWFAVTKNFAMQRMEEKHEKCCFFFGWGCSRCILYYITIIVHMVDRSRSHPKSSTLYSFFVDSKMQVKSILYIAISGHQGQ